MIKNEVFGAENKSYITDSNWFLSSDPLGILQNSQEKIESNPHIEDPQINAKIGCSPMDRPFLEKFSVRNTVKLTFYCKYCNNFIRDMDNFKGHFKAIHKIKMGLTPLMCPVDNCPQMFGIADKPLLTKHVKTDHLFYTIKCNDCCEVFATSAQKQAHMAVCIHATLPTESRDKNQLQGKNGCSSKNVEFLKYFLLRNYSKHSFFCKPCNKFEIALELFNIHIEKIHKIDIPDKPLVCPVSSCKSKFKIEEKRKLQQHVKMRHLGYNFKCRYCDEVFNMASVKERHENKICANKSENEIMEFEEDNTMNLRYPNNAITLFKEILKMQPQTKKFSCKLCNGEKVNLKSIINHFHLYHNTDEQCPILCPVEDCEVSLDYSERFHLASHLSKVHLCITCSACDFIFFNHIQKIEHESETHGLPKVMLEDILIKEEPSSKFDDKIKNDTSSSQDGNTWGKSQDPEDFIEEDADFVVDIYSKMSARQNIVKEELNIIDCLMEAEGSTCLKSKGSI